MSSITNGDLKSRLRDAGIQPPPSKGQGAEARQDWLVEAVAALAADVHEIKTHKFWKQLLVRTGTLMGILSGFAVGLYYALLSIKLFMK